MSKVHHSVKIDFDADIYEILEVEAARKGRPIADLVADTVKRNLAAVERPPAPPAVGSLPLPGRMPHRRAGSMKGRIWMAEDFDQPLGDFRDFT